MTCPIEFNPFLRPDIQQCDVCKALVEDGTGAWDVDDRLWCNQCMIKWEREHERHWEDGRLFTLNTP